MRLLRSVLFVAMWWMSAAGSRADVAHIDTRSTGDLVDRLAPLAESAIEKLDAPSQCAILLEQLFIDVAPESHDRFRDRIFRVGISGKIPSEYLMIARANYIELREAAFWWVDENGTVHTTSSAASNPSDSRLQIEPPPLPPGTLCGMRWEEHHRGWPRWFVLPLSGEVPVLDARVRVRSHPAAHFELMPEDIPLSQIESVVHTTSGGLAQDMSLRADLTPQSCGGTYRPNPLAFGPRFVVRLHSILQEDFRGGRVWLPVARWDWIAMNFGVRVDRALEDAFEARERALQIGQGLPTARHYEPRLCEWVRDHIRDRGGTVWGLEELRGPSDVLSSGSGNQWEKALLLATMLRSVGANIEVVWVGSDSGAGVATEIPSEGQLGEFLVRVDGSRWYDPTCETCPPGSVRSSLLGSRGLIAPSNMLERSERFWVEVRNLIQHDGIRASRRSLVDYINEVIRSTDWVHWTQVPPLDSGLLREEVWLRPEAQKSLIAWTGGRGSWISEALHASADSSVGLEDLLLRRQPTSTGLKIFQSEETADSLKVAAWLEGPTPPESTNEWVLPASWIYGGAFLEPWELSRTCAFHNSSAREIHRTVHLPAPAGWGQIFLPEDVGAEVGPLRWSRTVRRRGEELLVDLSIRIEAVHVERVDLQAALRGAIEQCLEVLSRPMVFGRGA